MLKPLVGAQRRDLLQNLTPHCSIGCFSPAENPFPNVAVEFKRPRLFGAKPHMEILCALAGGALGVALGAAKIQAGRAEPGDEYLPLAGAVTAWLCYRYAQFSGELAKKRA